jgi:hypothetical protein
LAKAFDSLRIKLLKSLQCAVSCSLKIAEKITPGVRDFHPEPKTLGFKVLRALV